MPDLQKLRAASSIRNSIHNLVIVESNELDNEVYFGALKGFIATVEGSTKYTYMDGIPNPKPGKGGWMPAADFYALSEEEQKRLAKICKEDTKKPPIPTVGIGFNIKEEETQERLNNLLGEEGFMQQVAKGEKDLTEKQISIIFRHEVEIRANELHTAYAPYWERFRANEKLVISSLYFNHPKLAKSGTSFHRNMMKYAETSDPKYLHNAINEVEKRSNPGHSAGIQNRRDAEGELLNSPKVPNGLYTKPDEEPDSKKITKATLKKTFIPILNDKPKKGINKDYFIWRTSMDNKVRSSHAALEGKIFRKDSPPGGYMPKERDNCRCSLDEVPDYIEIEGDEIVEQKAFEMYLRKGIKHPSLRRSYNKENQKFTLEEGEEMTEQKAFEIYLRKGIKHPLLNNLNYG